MHPAKLYSEHRFFVEYLGERLASCRILNAGSAETRYGKDCVNVDIQDKPGVDIVCDLHQLPADLGTFDVVICNAVLQYCKDPRKVASEFYRVLKPGGYVYVDAPWVQPYCSDTADRYRYSVDQLRAVFSDFELVEMGPTIPAGSAFAMLGVHIAQTLTGNRYINYALGKFASVVLYPFRWIVTARPDGAAGAFFLVARKPMEKVATASE